MTASRRACAAPTCASHRPARFCGWLRLIGPAARCLGWLGSGYAKDKGWIRKPKKGKAKAGELVDRGGAWSGWEPRLALGRAARGRPPTSRSRCRCVGSSASLDKTEWLKGTAWDQANKKKEAKQS